MKAKISLLVALAAVAVPAASAHRGQHARGYTSTLTALEPSVPGVFVNVLGGDDRLRLSNYTGKVVTVLGYAGEPFLRFEPRGVYENYRSPNAYLDRFRYPPPRARESADANVAPEWVKVADGVTFEWHDHRIHWAYTTPPPVVQRAPNRVHLISNWRVPARAGGRAFLIKGFLGYVPPPKSRGDRDWLMPLLVGSFGAAAIAVLAVGLGARRRTRRAP